MSLRSKIIISLLSVMTAYMILNYQIQKILIYPNFTELERSGAEKDIKRCVEAVQREIVHLDSLCHDWAAWNDTYEFAEDRNHEYIKKNLIIDTFIGSKLNVIYLINKDRAVVWGEIRDLDTKEHISVKELSPDRFTSSDHPLFAHDYTRDSLSKITIRGIFMTASGPLMVSSRPIITSDNKGPVRGWVVLGRFLNPDMIEMLKSQTSVNFKILSIGHDPLPNDEKAFIRRTGIENKYYIKEQNNDKLHIHTVVQDIKSNPALLLTAVVNRDITAKGQKTVHFAMLSITVVGALILITILLLLNRLVEKPLGKLTFQIKKIGQSNDFSERLAIERNDEIGVLAKEFDNMVNQVQIVNKGLEVQNKKLQQAEGRFRTVVEQSMAAIEIYKPDGSRLLVNNAWEKFWNLKKENLSDFNILDDPECKRTGLASAFRKVQLGKSLIIPDILCDSEKIGLPSGRELWIGPRMYPITDQSGTVQNIVLTYDDITERKQAQEEILRTKVFLENIFKTSVDGIAVTDAEGTFTMVNDSMEKLTGYSSDELTGMHSSELGRNEENEISRGKVMIEKLYKNGFVDNYEHIWKNKEGDDVNVEMNMALIKDPAGEVIGAVSIARDIRGRKKALAEKERLEEKLRQSQKMESIGTLAGGVAHEFNNILSGIMGYTEIARDDAPEESPVGESLDIILKLSNRAKNIVKQILTFSRKGNKEQKLIQPHLIIEDSLKVLRATIPTTIEIRTSIDEQSGTIMADPTQINQIGTILCINAAHAMEDTGGVLEIGLTRVMLDAQDVIPYTDLKPGEYVKLTVSDTGAGIGSETIDRIFDPFFTTKEVGKGTGMGLAVAHGIIKDHGGEIAVASKLGEGTTFTVFLPKIEAKSETAKIDDDIQTGTENVLVVDDEDHLVFLMKTILGRLGYKVTAMTSSLEALELFKKDPQRYDIIITDLTMPNLTGDRLASEVTAIRPDMPVIISTGYTDAVDSEKVKQSGIAAFIAKPYQKQDLAKTIRLILDGK